MALLVDIEKTLGSFHLQVQLEAGDEVLGLCGNSGCGKSLTLRCIAGVEKPDRGRIILNGVTLFDSEKHINLSPQKRRTGLLFQNYALFPNMTVRQNIRTGTLRNHRTEEERNRKVADIMENFGLSDLAGHYPRQLSGGQQQRTALARILVSEPQILILVSHDRGEAYRLSDRIAMMRDGRTEKILSKEEWLLQSNSVIIPVNVIPQNVILVPKES